ncbi:MAG: ATPase, partial [Myxococcota bacterium]
MTKKKKNAPANVLRQSAEERFADELSALIEHESHAVPDGWRMSPRSVRTYITGGEAGGMTITPKYIGHPRLVEIAIATLITDRALLLI